MDPLKNFSYTYVETPPSPGDSGLDLQLRPGGSWVMPKGGAFNAVVWKAGVKASWDIAEIVRVAEIPSTNITSDYDHLLDDSIGVADESVFNPQGGTPKTTAVVDMGDGTYELLYFEGNAAGELTTVSGATRDILNGSPIYGDYITVDRMQENTRARTIVRGDQFEASLTEFMLLQLASGSLPAHLTNTFEIAVSDFQVLTGESPWIPLIAGIGWRSSAHTLPIVLAAAGFIPFPSTSVQNIPDSTNFLDWSAYITVSSIDGTNVLKVGCDGATTAHDTGFAVDWSNAGVIGTPIGADLSLDTANGIVSAAGGVFIAHCIFSGGWD